MGQAMDCAKATCEVAKENMMALICCNRGSKPKGGTSQRMGGRAWYDSIDKYNSSDDDETSALKQDNNLLYDDDDEVEEQVVIIKTQRRDRNATSRQAPVPAQNIDHSIF